MMNHSDDEDKKAAVLGDVQRWILCIEVNRFDENVFSVIFLKQKHVVFAVANLKITCNGRYPTN